MIPIEIEEPDFCDYINKNQNEFVLGIDFGTTNSVAYYQNKDIKELVLFDDKPYLKSIISITSDGFLSVGSVKKQAINILSIKRILSKKDPHESDYDIIEKEDGIYITAFDKEYSVVFLCSKILENIKIQTEKQSKENISKCVITVPAYFDDIHRNSIKQACSLVGLTVMRIINEPTSAIVAYNLEHQEDGMFAVYDLGGGTFDISIAKIEQGVIKIVANSGNLEIGGDDFDDLIKKKMKILMKNCINCENFLNHTNCSQNEYLTHLSQKIKHRLTDEYEIKEKIISKDKTIEFVITQDDFKNMSMHLIKETFKHFDSALIDAKINHKDLSGIILVGGATRMNVLKQELKQKYTDVQIIDTVDPDKIVAIGAVQKAKELMFGCDNILIDINPISIGIETLGGKFEAIIRRNATVPVLAYEIFSTNFDNQTAIPINIYQGERPFVKDCRCLGKFVISGIPKMKAKEPRVKITFQLDLDGILTVKAIEEKTGITQEIEIKPTYNLKIENVMSIQSEANKNIHNDEIKLKIFESNQKMKDLLMYTEHAIKNDSDIFGDDIKTITKMIKEYKNIIDTEIDLTKECKQFEMFILPFFEKLPTKYIKKILQK